MPNIVCNDYSFKVVSDQLVSNGIVDEESVWKKIIYVLIIQLFVEQKLSLNNYSWSK